MLSIEDSQCSAPYRPALVRNSAAVSAAPSEMLSCMEINQGPVSRFAFGYPAWLMGAQRIEPRGDLYDSICIFDDEPQISISRFLQKNGGYPLIRHRKVGNNITWRSNPSDFPVFFSSHFHTFPTNYPIYMGYSIQEIVPEFSNPSLFPLDFAIGLIFPEFSNPSLLP